MKTVHRLVHIGIAVVLIASCGERSAHDTSAMVRYTLQHDGLEREYFVYRPANHDELQSMPAIIYLHGYGGTATGTESEVARGLNDFAEQHGYLMVYPQGTWFMSQGGVEERYEITSWNHISDGFDSGPEGPICTEDVVRVECPPGCGTCGKCGWTSCHDDVGFLRTLVAQIGGELKANPESISIAGFSNGAMMAHRMACEASELFAAAVLVGGRLEPGFECTPTTRIPLLQMNGAEDDTVPFDGRASDGGYFFASSASVSERWTEGLSCGDEAQDWLVADEEEVQCSERCGASPQESLDCVWNDTDHRWPGTQKKFGSNGYCVTELQSTSMPERPICARPSSDPDLAGSRLMFEFLNRHQ